MTVGRIIYTCPDCGIRYGWFEMQKATRMDGAFICKGCGRIEDIDTMEVYNGNDDN